MRMLPSACCIGALYALISCTHKNITQDDIGHIEIIHNHIYTELKDVSLPGYKYYSWPDYPSDSIREIRERAKRLKRGMDEQQVVALMRPLVVNPPLIPGKYRDPEVVRKEFHFNASYKDLVKINESFYDPKRSDRFSILMKIPFSKKTGKLRKDGQELDLEVMVFPNWDVYYLPISEKRPIYQ